MAKPIRTRVERMKLRDLKLLEVNARYLRHETFVALVSNLRRDGALTSVPFAVREKDGRYLVLSGNHRVMAALEAGITEADVMVTDDSLPKQRRVAIQLSHNAVVGEDDPATLKELYDSLQDVDWRTYSGLDDKALELLEKVRVDSLAEANLDFQTVTLVFLPDELERLEGTWEAARQGLAGSKVAWLARMEEYERTLDALETAGRSYGVANVATCLLLVLDVFERHVGDLKEGFLNQDGEPRDSKRWVPLEALFGFHGIPAGAASVIERALVKMRERGEITDKNPWQAVAMWAADYLAGE